MATTKKSGSRRESPAKKEARLRSKRIKSGKAKVVHKVSRSRTDRLAKGMPYREKPLQQMNLREAPKEAMISTKGMSLRQLVKVTPKYFINYAADVRLREVQRKKTATGRPVIYAKSVSVDTYRSDRTQRVHESYVVGMDDNDLKEVGKHRSVLVQCSCISDTTRVLTSEGWQYVYRLLNRNRVTYIVDGSAYEGSAPYKTGSKELFDCKLSNGLTFRATENHKFLLENGVWAPLSAISSSSRLVTSRNVSKSLQLSDFSDSDDYHAGVLASVSRIPFKHSSLGFLLGFCSLAIKQEVRSENGYYLLRTRQLSKPLAELFVQYGFYGFNITWDGDLVVYDKHLLTLLGKQCNEFPDSPTSVSIVHKKSVGIQAVFDITVPDVTRFVIDGGVVAHNCENFVYYFEYANSVRNASRLLYSNGNAPVVTNPHLLPGCCKHLVALSKFIIDRGL